MTERKSNGFTLIETLVGISIGGAAIMGGMSLFQQEMDSNKRDSVATEIRSILSGVENRFLIDGFNVSTWSKTSWSNTNSVQQDLLKKQLIARDNGCGKASGWVPSLNDKLDVKLVPCSLWEKVPYGMELSAELKSDSTNFVENFNLILSFKDSHTDPNHFKENVKDMINISKHFRKQSTTGEGTYSLGVIDKRTGVDITSVQCINIGDNCALLANYNRAGASEYLKADGSVAMIGEHFKFIESRGQSPLTCVRWFKTPSNTWDKELNEECGIGIYETTGQPAAVDVVVKNGTFENIVLEQECKNFEWNGTTVIENGKSPCGMTKDGSEYYQVIDNIEAKTAVIKEGLFGTVNVNDLVATSISAETVNATTLFKAAKMIVGAGGLEVDGTSNFTGLVTADRVQVQNISGPIGNFDNINFDIQNLKNKDIYHDQEIAKLKNKDSLQDQEINNLRNALNNLSTAVPPGPSRAEIECSVKAPTYSHGSTSGNNSKTTCFYDVYAVWGWNGSSCVVRSYNRILDKCVRTD